MEVIHAYRPSVTNVRKYGVYFRYFVEYIKNGDTKSLWSSIKYVLTKRLPKQGYLARSEMGIFQIRGNTNDFQFVNRAYEEAIKQYLERNIDSFDVFIDLGACIGEYCIWLAGRGKTCVAVEPINFEALRKNIELNKLQDKIFAFNCGVGSRKERVFFKVPTFVRSSSHIDRESSEEPNVDIETLDDIVTRTKIDPSSRVIIKLDVEGMEPEVIAGGKEFIKSAKNLRVIYEHFPEDNFRNDKSLETIDKFKFYDIDKVNRIAIKEDEKSGIGK